MEGTTGQVLLPAGTAEGCGEAIQELLAEPGELKRFDLSVRVPVLPPLAYAACQDQHGLFRAVQTSMARNDVRCFC